MSFYLCCVHIHDSLSVLRMGMCLCGSQSVTNIPVKHRAASWTGTEIQSVELNWNSVFASLLE